MTYHICVPVETAIELLQQGNNLFEPASPKEVLRQLLAQKQHGKKYITGCDNENAEGL
jgi:hypothetical protein